MNLPKVVTDLIKAQNNLVSEDFANCFSETGVMIEEGMPYTGRIQIQELIEETNKKYRSVMKPVGYIEDGNSSVLSAECSGTFPGSPAVLKFHFVIVDGQIQHLKVTG
ncbi:nuclear transport factor 2 family protein [Terrimonas sp. NA20]|uniref:Nuclear transport factor 2 family protein n=1 Tax=Terrimonas ginsenosidimutans TaxID=2908004 RepID=A0ABS9L0B5_9BACT|nr:nuclear transport factor 2 family protein [Terrimonas ginsenosidimutans]MCG2618026.1 nuclear transport factor 2 family protein [Terrimonas ginsenosidimutans]